MHSATIIGAGVAGLTIAYQLARRAWDVTVVESNDAVGGLARTFHYGDFHFDVGPHRFHTDNPRVDRFVREILKDEAIPIARRSGARMFGRFHEWPLRPAVLLSMPFVLMLRAAANLLFKERMAGESFEADVVNKYGRALYDVFFEPYTRKFLFHSPSELHRDWARAGVNRAVIDKRVQADSLWGLLKTTLLPKPVETTFLYPPHGVGRFSDLLADAIRNMGGRILLGEPVRAVAADGSRVTAVRTSRHHLGCENIVWTAPITQLNRMLGVSGIDLEYLSTIFYNFEVRTRPNRGYQWIYFGGDEIFSRVTAPEAFLPTTAPAEKSGLCVELTCRQGDERWQDPERYTARIIADLVRTGTLRRADDIERVHIERVPYTYPMYKLNYLNELTRNLNLLGRYSNLVLAGRCGRFWYNNMDHSIGQGLTVADKMIRGEQLRDFEAADREFWVSPETPASA